MISRKIFFPAALTLLLASPAATAAPSAETTVSVFKTPWCGCCHDWAEAVGKAGYRVSSSDFEDLSPIRRQAGVPADMVSCHIAAVDGYFLEGHIPLEALARLLAERPDIAGIAVPGMPQGSLGMGDGPAAAYDVYAIPRDRRAAPFVFHRVGN